MGGFTPDALIAVYAIGRVLSSKQTTENNEERVQQLVTYNFTADERRNLLCGGEILALRTHPSKFLAVMIAKTQGDVVWMACICDLMSSQTIITIRVPMPGLYVDFIQSITYSRSGQFMISYPSTQHGKNGTRRVWSDLNVAHLHSDPQACIRVLTTITSQVPDWNVSHLLPSGKIIYFSNDGWIKLWDKNSGVSRLKYVSVQHQWADKNCTSVVEAGDIIRIAIFSPFLGLVWFDVKAGEFEGTSL